MDSKYFVFFLAVLFFSVSSFVSVSRYFGYSIEAYDLGLNDNIVYNTVEGRFFWSSLTGFSHLANHFSPIILFFAFLYVFLPSPLVLLFLQSLFLAVGVFPLYWMAKRRLGSLGVFFPVFYVLYPAIEYMGLLVFSPVLFVIPLFLFMLYFHERGNFKAVFLFAFLSLLCMENVSLPIVFFGAYVFSGGRRKEGLVLVSLGLVWFFSYFCFSRLFFPGQYVSFFRYAYLFEDPFRIFSMKWNYRLEFLSNLFAPLAFLPLLSPWMLFPALPVFLQNVLSEVRTMHSIQFQYPSLLIPFLFFALISAFEKLGRGDLALTRKLCYWLLCVEVFSVAFLDLGLVSRAYPFSSGQDAGDIVGLVPRGASISTLSKFYPHVSQGDAMLFPQGCGIPFSLWPSEGLVFTPIGNRTYLTWSYYEKSHGGIILIPGFEEPKADLVLIDSSRSAWPLNASGFAVAVDLLLYGGVYSPVAAEGSILLLEKKGAGIVENGKPRLKYFLSRGWSNLEDWGRWAVGNNSSVLLLNEHQVSWTISFNAYSFHRARKLSVFLGDEFLFEKDIMTDGTRVSFSFVSDQPDKLLFFYDPECIRPVDFGLEDTRCLSVGFSDFLVEASFV